MAGERYYVEDKGTYSLGQVISEIEYHTYVVTPIKPSQVGNLDAIDKRLKNDQNMLDQTETSREPPVKQLSARTNKIDEILNGKKIMVGGQVIGREKPEKIDFGRRDELKSELSLLSSLASGAVLNIENQIATKSNDWKEVYSKACGNLNELNKDLKMAKEHVARSQQQKKDILEAARSGNPQTYMGNAVQVQKNLDPKSNCIYKTDIDMLVNDERLRAVPGKVSLKQ